MAEWFMPILAIYERPQDCPESFVVREWIVTHKGRLFPNRRLATCVDLEAARATVKRAIPNAVRLPRSPSDDPVVVESWI